MPSFTANQIGMSYPKPRDLIFKIIPIARADSSTAKCAIPANAVVVVCDVFQATDAVTGAASYNLGWSGATTGLLNAFSLPTTKVGLAAAGTAAGAQMFVKQAVDRNVIGTFTVGTSSAGGTGYIRIGYYVVGAQETLDD
jgi:hypothetical protein